MVRMKGTMHADPLYLDDNLEDDATVISANPLFLEHAVTAPQVRELPQTAQGVQAGQAAQAGHAMAYPSMPTPVRGTYTEPLRGYPPGAAFVPRRLDQSVVPGTLEIASEGLPATTQMPVVNVAEIAQQQPHQHHQPIGTGRPDNYTMPLGMAADLRLAQAQPIATPYLGAAAQGPTSTYADSGVRPSPAAHRQALPEGATLPAPAAAAAATPSCGAPSPRLDRAVLGAAAGAIAGALLWGGIGFLTGGWEFKYAAIVVGFLTGVLAARFAGGHSKTVGLIGAAAGLGSIVLGKALFEVLVQPHLTLGQHIAYHATIIDVVFYIATIATGFTVGAGVADPRRALRRARRLVGRYVPAFA